MTTGVALSGPALENGSSQDRRAAIEYLADGLEASITAQEAGDGPDPLHGRALWLLVALAFVRIPSPMADAQADRLLRMATRALRLPGLAPEEAALWHALNAQAHYTRAKGNRRLGDIGPALASLRTAQVLLPEHHDMRGPLMMFASVVLYSRHEADGSLEDADAATAYLRAANELADSEALPAQASAEGGSTKAVFETLRASAASIGLDVLALRVQDVGGPLIARLRQALAGLPQDSKDQHRLLAMAMLGWLLVENADLSSDGPAAEEGMNLLLQVADQVDEDNPYRSHFNNTVALAQGQAALATRNILLINDAIKRVSTPTASSGESSSERGPRAHTLAMLYKWRYMLSGKPHDIQYSISVLARSHRRLAQEPSWRSASMLMTLAENYRIRGLRLLRDNQHAIKTAMAGLREAAADVILQAGTRRSLATAAKTRSWAGTAALWCLIDGHPDQAVQALEVGRSLVLHAATVAADVPALLRTAGYGDLAARWQREAGRTSPIFDLSPLKEEETAYLSSLLRLPTDEGIPSDIRMQALAALGGTEAIAALLDPPSIEDLSAALRNTGYDAFVYLLSPEPGMTSDAQPRPGCALIVRDDGHVQEIPLPQLAGEPVAAYDAALQGWLTDIENLSLITQWNNALEALCDWAWEAMAGPVLSHAAGWGLSRPPRLVLVPTGNLGVVPWHAARTARADRSPHYAIEDAVFGYAASARQLISAGRRQRRPWASSPLLLSDATGHLPMAAVEAQELRRLFYPDAMLLGQSDAMPRPAGTRDEVLARLPGGSAAQVSMLHCCCHASVRGDLSSSYLQLADDEQLTVAQIMAQAQGRNPEAPGYLAVLSACTSDFADVDHDEALTLASALLAAGASGVVGTRWPVNDLAAAELMVAFHHFLNREHASPADALRAAQLWMLGRNRTALEDLAPQLATQLSARRLRHIRNWAAFTYQGITAS